MVGNSFACADDSLWETTYELSPSLITVNKAIIKYDKMVNREGKQQFEKLCKICSNANGSDSATRNVTAEANLIKFLVPISVLNIDNVHHGVKRYVSFAVKVGEEKMWNSLSEFDIEPEGAPKIAGPLH